ncbi:hypothetical protein AMTRI_Chr05g56690 [Amborella trichopoda]
MPHTISAKKHGGDQLDGNAEKMRTSKIGRSSDDDDNIKRVRIHLLDMRTLDWRKHRRVLVLKNSLIFVLYLAKRLKDVEISIPIVYGTISFWLGKKANEYNSHKWTVYIRGATNEDLSVAIKRVLLESGWGEFEVAITVHFHSDYTYRFHLLKLYLEDDPGPQSTKKPVVVESYDEINHPAATLFRLPVGSLENTNERKRGDTKDHSLSQWFNNFSEADELLRLATACVILIIWDPMHLHVCFS